MERNTIKIVLDGREFTAHREAHSTGGADPTYTVRWRGRNEHGWNFDVREFQSGYTGTLDGVEQEVDCEPLVVIHQSFEAFFDAMTRYIDPQPHEEDPMGPPSRYE